LKEIDTHFCLSH